MREDLVKAMGVFITTMATASYSTNRLFISDLTDRARTLAREIEAEAAAPAPRMLDYPLAADHDEERRIDAALAEREGR